MYRITKIKRRQNFGKSTKKTREKVLIIDDETDVTFDCSDLPAFVDPQVLKHEHVYQCVLQFSQNFIV